MVESKVHRVGPREGGRIAELAVEVGATVRAGQVVARLDVSDLHAERRRLQAQLESLEDLMDADRRRFSLEYSRLQLQLETDEHWLAQEYASVQSQLAELTALNSEIERLREAEEAGLGRARDLGDLVVRRDAVARYVSERTKEIRPGRRGAAAGTGRQDDEVLTSMLGDRMERVHEVTNALVLLEQRMAYRTVVAPCDGPVVEVLHRPGDIVAPYTPVVAIEDATVAHAVVFVPETQDLRVQAGAQVQLHSKRARAFDTRGEVEFVHPGFSPIPARFTFRGQVAWARKLRVRLAPGHRLVPGELVRVSVLHGEAAAAVGRTAHAADVGTARPDARPAPLLVPASLAARSRFEPSGMVWLDDLDRYLIVSDDTGHKSRSDHAPWVFLLDAEGRVEEEPVPLHGIDVVNDLEAVTATGDGRLLLLSSNNASKRGRRPRSRQLLLEVRRDGRRLSVARRVALLPALLAGHGPAELSALGLGVRDKDGLPLLNLEGMAWQEGDLLLGLKQPIGPGGAVVWRLSDVDALLETGRLEPGRVSVWGAVDLRTPDGRPRGVSDLAFDAGGRLLALSTVPGAADDEQLGGLHRIARDGPGRLVATTLAAFPGHKPEGLCPSEAGRVTVVFDADAGTPSWAEVELR